MPPHGSGMIGSNHSHNTKYPDDTWNLYAMLDVDETRALNVTQPQNTVGIFKPHALRFQEEPKLLSDADAEILITVRFTSPVSLRKIMVIGGGEEAHHPSLLHCYVNTDTIDFNNIQEFHAVQSFQLPINSRGVVELTTVLQPFTNITTVAFYFPENHGGCDSTILQYIGMQGDHTHYRREAVDTVYEVLCNGQDICQPEQFQGELGHQHHMH
jgi:hypothetical protein